MNKPDTAFPSTHPARGYLHVAEVLRREIRSMGVGGGGRLPSERELTRLLKISRTSLREALIVLELQGEIDIRVGSGIYLKEVQHPEAEEPAAVAASEADDGRLGQSPREVNQARYFLESGVAAHAARFMTRAQLRDLGAALSDMRRALRQRKRRGDQPLADADGRFHMVLAAAADNELVSRLLRDLFDQRYSPVGGSMHRLFDNETVWQDAIQEHQDIYDAVVSRDPLQAQAAMQRHLSRAYARLMAVIG
ncbi:MAG TPA: FCD domain-containing protein [Castellaniella sp.]|uniref:FadR/GntR family transcriptional regulator n=1 Tax=Castellaniella sp. TaxID=1955812 RepID=UPI002F207909